MRRSSVLRRWLDQFLNSTKSNKLPSASGRVLSSKRRSRPWVEQLEDRLAPTANTVDWADWTSAVPGQAGSAQATITVPGVNPITVSYAGEVTFANINGGPQYWVPTVPYLSQSVSDAPPLPDIVALSGGNTTVDTLTFSQTVTDPILGIVSLGGGEHHRDVCL